MMATWQPPLIHRDNCTASELILLGLYNDWVGHWRQCGPCKTQYWYEPEDRSAMCDFGRALLVRWDRATTRTGVLRQELAPVKEQWDDAEAEDGTPLA